MTHNVNPYNAAETLPDEMAMIDRMLAGELEDSEVESVADGRVVETYAGAEIPDDVLSVAVKSLESEEFYKNQERSNDDQHAADKPSIDVEQPMLRKIKGANKAAKPAKAPIEPKVKAEKAPKAPPRPQIERVTFAGNKKSAVLEARLGGQSDKFLILEDSDALLDPTTLALKQAMLREDFDLRLAKKVAEKGIMLFRDLSKGVTLENEVMRRAFQVLSRDGFLTSGDKGNLQVDLAAKYSVGTQRAQASQVFSLFQFLKIVEKSGSHYMLNTKSTIFSAAKY